MFMEALAVIIRQKNHLRITRLFRPMFFIDTYYLAGVRRYVSCGVIPGSTGD
jgi:two pore calcium channel protein 1